jgi:hypothetical protein
MRDENFGVASSSQRVSAVLHSLFSKLLKHAKMSQLQRSSLGQTNFDWADRGQITGVPTVQEDFTHRLFWISRT